MNLIFDSLLNGLKKGFIDHTSISEPNILPELLVNDPKNHKKVLSSIEHGLRNCDEFWFAVAFVTSSGVASLFSILLELEERGIKGKIVVSQYLNFSQPEALKRLLKLKNIELRISTSGNLHSKGYLFKNEYLYDLIIGSSNLTQNALSLNKEWNLKITATENSYIILNSLSEFENEFNRSEKVTLEFIHNYESIYKKNQLLRLEEKVIQQDSQNNSIQPNSMQIAALINLSMLRKEGKNKALLISATGTGKTYLSAFDVKEFKANKCLFIVHRENILTTAKKSFQKIIPNKSMGLFTGNIKETDSDFIFSTIQTISKENNLKYFEPHNFDYIIIDETHRSGAESYLKILNYFNPKFLLGMTATPERTDGYDIFKHFDNNIAYEIRLSKALEENILCPFHYYGITDLTVDGKIVEDKSSFTKLTAIERIDRIIDTIELYGSDNGNPKGLVFCSDVKESKFLARQFCIRGITAIALDASNSEEERVKAIENFEDSSNKLNYIFTVDIFNEGIDIPNINQIIMLRPTQSAIIFVQQLGRGLRKTNEKDYLTVIDFIGNYQNNFMVPIALFGDKSYNKDNLRKLINNGNAVMPGSSTISFDKIAKERIYEAINNANFQDTRELKNDYNLLKYRLGRIPMMMDFVQQNFRDPFNYVSKFKSFFNFVEQMEDSFKGTLNNNEKELLSLFTFEIFNSKRIDEIIVLSELINKSQTSFSQIKNILDKSYSINFTEKKLNSVIRVLNFSFYRKEIQNIVRENELLKLSSEFAKCLNNETFKLFLIDSLHYSKQIFESKYDNKNYADGFILYNKYSRKDVSRLLNWEFNEEATMFGYKIVDNTCPIFINYNKDDGITETTKYEDHFINCNELLWYTKNNRTFISKDVIRFREIDQKLRLPIFVKKNNAEGSDFYYLGDAHFIQDSFKETSIIADGKNVPIVSVILKLEVPVENSIYDYLTSKSVIKNSVDKTIIKKILPFTILSQSEIIPFINSIPIYDIKIAAGKFSIDQIHSELKWARLTSDFKYDKKYFICQIVGDSMDKIIPSNSWALFKLPEAGSRNGKIVLVQSYKIQNSELGSGYTIKEYTSEKNLNDEGWSHSKIILKPKSNNKTHQDIILELDYESDLKIIGEFVKVLD